MLGELMTFPVRAGLRVTGFALRTTLTASARALALASGALKAMSGSGTDQSQETGASSTSPSSTRAASPSVPTTSTTGNGVDPRSEASAPPEVEPDPAGAAESAIASQPVVAEVIEEPEPVTAEVIEEPEPITEEPAHVSEERVLVEEFAEPGAEDGAGASITVDEPWDGYAHLNAKDVTGRVAASTAAELAAIQLYESLHKKRDTVLSAVERELRSRAAADRQPDSH